MIFGYSKGFEHKFNVSMNQYSRLVLLFQTVQKFNGLFVKRYTFAIYLSFGNDGVLANIRGDGEFEWHFRSSFVTVITLIR